jgi:hypothetical protein
MITRRITLYFKAFIIISYLLYCLPAHAQLSAAVRYKLKPGDTTAKDFFENDFNIPVLYDVSKAPAAANKARINNEADVNLIEGMETHLSNRQERKKLMGYLKELSANNNEVNYNQSKVKVYYRLANVFARLRLYPLAMKCFFKTMQYSKGKQTNNNPAPLQYPADPLAADSVNKDSTLNTNYLSINTKDDSVFINAPGPVGLKDKTEEKSKAITYDRIINTFNDGKKAAAYALLFHVKQPVPGKPKVFAFTNTGHTFITLIKYNTDSTSVSISFGFYPQKDNLFSATPLDPSCSGTFKNDCGHRWDEVMGKFISKKRFEKILLLTKRYDGLEYHLSKNNCTDFAIKAASYAGFGVSNSKGSWPLGHGNNPAVTGQSIIAGGVYDDDSKADLFINFNEVLNKSK